MMSKDGFLSLTALLKYCRHCESAGIKIDSWVITDWTKFILGEVTGYAPYQTEIALLSGWVNDCNDGQFTISASDVVGWMLAIVEEVVSLHPLQFEELI